MDFCPALDMAKMCIELQATLSESEEWSGKDVWTVGAAWAQAIFSVIAIAAAVWISNREHARTTRHQDMERRQVRINEIRMLEAIVFNAENILHSTAAWVRYMKTNSMNLDLMKQRVRLQFQARTLEVRLKEVPLFMLPDASDIMYFTRLESIFHRVPIIMDEASSMEFMGVLPDASLLESLAEETDAIRAETASLLGSLRDEIDKLTVL